MSRKLLPQIGVLLCGCALGVAMAYGMEHAIQLKEGRAELLDYARRMVEMGDQAGREDNAAIAAVVNDNLPFCSDQELDFMRAYVFKAPHIRDMGRTKDGVLYCTSGLGLLSRPRKMPVPNTSSGDLKIYVGTPLILSTHTKGFVVEKDGVSIVLSPSAMEHNMEPPKSYSTLLYDRASRHMLHTSEPEMPLSDEEVVAGKLIERGGIFYQPLCSDTSMVCRIAAEPRAAVLNPKGRLSAIFLAASGFVGGLMGLMFIQFYRGHRSMERQLRRAIEKGSLTLVYQPLVNLETHAIVGAEAPARWINEDGESIPPDVFIALAEERGFICEITRLVSRMATSELCDLLATGNFRITMNISPEDLKDAGFFEQLTTCMEDTKIEPSSIGFEITERSTANQKMAVEAIARLKRAGHAVYIDDFGTGYSSLAYLHHLDVDAIKIDRSFTQTVGTGAVTASVVPQILEMAAQLELQVVVEGIETQEQAEYFRALGRGILGQGWLYGKALSIAEFRKLPGMSHYH